MLETKSADALMNWLKDHGYPYTSAIAGWVKPYLGAGWKITAFKVATQGERTTTAAAVRLSFQTERPVFPYREPDYENEPSIVGAGNRLLRIYFVAEARYNAAMVKGRNWDRELAFAGKLSDANRSALLQSLNLATSTGPSEFWLTEFEHTWPYTVAPGDVWFSRDDDQSTVTRPPIIHYVASDWKSIVGNCGPCIGALLFIYATFRVLSWLVRKRQ